MWISRRIFADIRDELVAARATVDALQTRFSALDTTVDWFRVRITQLEHERALMLQNYLGVTVPHLSIEKSPVSVASARPSYDPVPHFDDIGDDEAKRLGIDWNPETSEVTYREIT